MLSIVYVLLIMMCSYSLFFVLASLPSRKTRWTRYRRFRNIRIARLMSLWMNILRLSANGTSVIIYEQLLAGSGIRIKAIYYLLCKRTISILLLLVGAITWLSTMNTSFLLPMTTFLLVVVVAYGDKHLFVMLRTRRSYLIVKDVHHVSKQLLYYQGAKINMHSKLKRCLPNTSTLRKDMELLTKEWYEGASIAIDKFKQRVGTNEGYSFAETIHALSLYDDNRYYDLLRERIDDYKEKMELEQAGKKETNSYVLFVLAGLPIMNTFRVFIYPWVQEGQKLFQTLN